MLNFIRIHPWRLEIAPAISAALALGSILCYRYSDFAWSLEQIARAEGLSGVPRLGLTATFGMLLLLWFNEIAWNHTWVVAERKQRINWVAPLMQSVIIGQGLLIFEIARISSRLSMSLSTPRFEWLALAALLVSGMVVTLLAELTRTRSERPEPVETDFSPSDSMESARIPYIERDLNGYTLLTGLGVAVIGALPVLYRVHAGWITFIIGIIGAAALASLSVRKVVVAEDAITLSAGLIRKRVLLLDVQSCTPSHQEPLARRRRAPGEKKAQTFFITTGRCLEIVTRSGQVYLFGMLRPKHACGLMHQLSLLPEKADDR